MGKGGESEGGVGKTRGRGNGRGREGEGRSLPTNQKIVPTLLLLCSFNSTMPQSTVFYYYLFRLQIYQCVTIAFCSVVFGITWKLPDINKILWCVERRHLVIAVDGRHISVIS